jgi:uncharacterized protein (TIGR02246 family)
VGKVLTSLAAAYNGRDPRAFAQHFTPAGEFIDADGDVFEGRTAIASEFTALFQVNPQSALEIATGETREISPGVLSADCVATFAATSGSEKVTVDFAALVVRQADGGWLLAGIRSNGERKLSTPRAHLKELEWMIGDWVDESNESTMHISTRWADDGPFILSSFGIRVAGRNVMTGTQRIGWDASFEKFRSWVFDSEGGHAEGIWTELDDRWIVKSTGASPDGDACSATHTYEQKGPDAFLFSVTDRIVGKELQPEFISHVVRKPPDPITGSKPAPTPRGK